MHPNNYKRYRKRQRINIIKNIVAILILFTIGCAIAYFITQDKLVFSSDGAKLSNEQQNDYDNTVEQDIVGDIVIEDAKQEEQQEEQQEIPLVILEEVKGLYFNTQLANNETYVESVFEQIESGQINTLVFVMKNYNGSLNYQSQQDNTISTDLTEIIKRAIEKDVYLIGEVSAYADNNFARSHINAGIKTLSGVNWLDIDMQGWLNPYADEGNIYLTQIITEVLNLGFDEILLSNFHFPVRGRLDLIYYDYGNQVLSIYEILEKRIEEFSKIGTISLYASEYLFTQSQSSGEDLEKLKPYVRNIYINADIEQFNALENDKKAIISNSIQDENYNYIIK